MSLSTESIQRIACLNDKVFFLYMSKKSFHLSQKCLGLWIRYLIGQQKKLRFCMSITYIYIYIPVLMRGLKFKVSEGSIRSMCISNGVPPGYINISLPLLVRLKQWTNDYKVILAWKLLWSYLLTYGKNVLLFFFVIIIKQEIPI